MTTNDIQQKHDKHADDKHRAQEKERERQSGHEKKRDYFWYVCTEERAAMHHAHVLCAAHL